MPYWCAAPACVHGDGIEMPAARQQALDLAQRANDLGHAVECHGIVAIRQRIAEQRCHHIVVYCQDMDVDVAEPALGAAEPVRADLENVLARCGQPAPRIGRQPVAGLVHQICRFPAFRGVRPAKDRFSAKRSCGVPVPRLMFRR
ncbi:MAG TPA: hypothetical protein PKZ76_04145 [Xanthomonadaceae bacterium]|nr:hypothetical protein [Xanthomonadaceae bacterium]